MINSGLSPELRANYLQLQQRLRDQTLDATQHAELLRLSDVVEEYQAERTAALAELATLRGQSLEQLMCSFKFEGPTQE